LGSWQRNKNFRVSPSRWQAAGGDRTHGLDLDQTATTAEDAMSEPQLRWRQRLESLQRALRQLEAALLAHDAAPESEVIGMAVIKAYEFSIELSWKTLKDLLSHEGLDVMAHTYDVNRARLALALIRDHFAPALEELAVDLERR
jgi:hypothetical protein